MKRQFIEDLDQYLQAKTNPSKEEQNLIKQLEDEKPRFEIAFLNLVALERNGYDIESLSDDDLQELAGMMGDYYCGGSSFEVDMEMAWNEFNGLTDDDDDDDDDQDNDE